MKTKNENPILKQDGEVNPEINLVCDKILSTIDSWTISVETDEEKIERLRQDILKKKYPIFPHIDDIIEKVKSGVKIYSNDIMREVGFGTTSLGVVLYTNISRQTHERTIYK